MAYRYENYGDLRVAFTDDLDGGGRGFGQQTVPAVQQLLGPVDRAFEFCAGPGFIGFSLLAHGLCRSLCLADVNPAAVETVKHTIALNGLEDRVSVYVSDGLETIPAHEQWDLVVSGPPHFDGAQTGKWGLRAFDPGWNIHKRFYAGVRSHLRPHGQCLFLENYHGSTEDTFLPMLDAGGLEYAGSFMIKGHLPYPMADIELPPLNTFFFFWTRVKHADIVWRDARPHRQVELTLDRSGAVRHNDGGSDTPLRLPIGEKYAVHLSSQKSGWQLGWDFWQNRVRVDRSRPATDGLRVECIPTAPNKIVDESGAVLVEFE